MMERTNYLRVVPCKVHGDAFCCCYSVLVARREAYEDCIKIADGCIDDSEQGMDRCAPVNQVAQEIRDELRARLAELEANDGTK